MSVASQLPARPRILVINLRRLGDVLLATPLMRTLRRGIPGAKLDVLVFDGSEGILRGNPDIDSVLTMPERPTTGESLKAIAQVWRRYDLVVSTQTGDRPTFYSLLAGRIRVGLVPREGGGAWWKRMALHHALVEASDKHRVDNLLTLTDALDLPRHNGIVCPQNFSANEIAPREPYAVLHAHPMFRYKQWTEAGWRALAQALKERGLGVVATGGPDAKERAYLDHLWANDAEVTRVDGRLDWGQLATLLAGASVYVGPDTSVTHLAAGAGCATVALYGPTDPRLWGPWPSGGLDDPWVAAGSIQRRGNVWLVQNSLPCTPCQKEGCERHIESYSRCLDELSARQVLTAVDQALAWSRERSGQWRVAQKTGMQGDMPLHPVKP
jgi:heptosyltransferase-3